MQDTNKRTDNKSKSSISHPTNTQTHDKQPPSIVRQQLQTEKLLSKQEELKYAKIIRHNFHSIIRHITNLQPSTDTIVTLQKTVAAWEKKEHPIKPGKRRLDYILVSMESIYKELQYDDETLYLCQQFTILAGEIEEAKDILITANLRLVCSIAKRYTDRGLSLSDLIQEGCLGLMRAVFRFNHKSGKRFSTYASWWVRQAITKSIPEKTRTIKLPAHFLVSRSQFNKTFRTLNKQLGRRPTMKELSRDTYMSYSKMLTIIETSIEPSSLDERVGDNDGNLMDIIENKTATIPDDVLITADLHKHITSLLDTLTKREAQVLKLRFGLGGKGARTLDEVGQKFKVSRERIRQIEQGALQRLRHPSRSDHMRCFLEGN